MHYASTQMFQEYERAGRAWERRGQSRSLIRRQRDNEPWLKRVARTFQPAAIFQTPDQKSWTFGVLARGNRILR